MTDPVAAAQRAQILETRIRHELGPKPSEDAIIGAMVERLAEAELRRDERLREGGIPADKERRAQIVERRQRAREAIMATPKASMDAIAARTGLPVRCIRHHQGCLVSEGLL